VFQTIHKLQKNVPYKVRETSKCKGKGKVFSEKWRCMQECRYGSRRFIPDTASNPVQTLWKTKYLTTK